ncbi:MAG: ATP-binding protein [Planctomycetota bacterium]
MNAKATSYRSSTVTVGTRRRVESVESSVPIDGGGRTSARRLVPPVLPLESWFVTFIHWAMTLLLIWAGTWWARSTATAIMLSAVFLSALVTLTLMSRSRIRRQQRELLTKFSQSAQKQLDQLHDRWRSLHSETRQNASALLQLVDGVVVLTPDETILLINPSAVSLLNLNRRDGLLGRSFTEMVRVPELLDVLRSVVREQQTQELTIDFQHEGDVRPIRVRVDLIDTGESFNLQLSLRDETEPRRVEEMRREFVANVSHELKTPLAAIKGYAETIELALGDDPETAVYFLNQINSQCQRLEHLVNDMMKLAHAQSGRDHLRLSSVSLTEVVRESIQTYIPVALANDLMLDGRLPSEVAKVFSDREATLTIANNLIGNAVRYTPSGGHIDVQIERDGEMWCLRVIDDGHGIPADDQTRIFERFYRGSRSIESATSSTGLGLAIVKNLSQALGGDVSVQSEVGKGSTFEVRLPAVMGESVSDSVLSSRERLVGSTQA